ncbi:MAG: alpha/beta hydrolase [bacterium]|nr:alpha/beta hydrolase [bacterium]
MDDMVTTIPQKTLFNYIKIIVGSLLGLLIVFIYATAEPPNPNRDKWQHVIPPIPPDIEYIKDIEYGKGGNVSLKLDFIRKKERPQFPMPVIVWIHGGGWRSGSKESHIYQLIYFARKGYFCASINYRLTDVATFPAQIEDCKCAIRFLRAKANEYNLNPNRIGVWGSSAGGHLAALLGTSGGIKELEGSGGWQNYSSRVQAVCDWFGPSDFSRFIPIAAISQQNEAFGAVSGLLGGPISEKKELARQASPVTYVTPDDPPFLIMHGDQDKVVSIRQSEILFNALQQAGVEVTFRIIEGEGHGGPKFWRDPENRRIVEQFFDTHLK